MNQTRRGARKLATELHDDGTPLISVYTSRTKVKEMMNMRSLGKKEDIPRGFKKKGWERDANVFYHPELLKEKITHTEEEFRRECRYVISQSDLVDELSAERTKQPKGKWGSIIKTELMKRGWITDSDRGFYILPVGEVLEGDELLYYIFKSMEQVVEDS